MFRVYIKRCRVVIFVVVCLLIGIVVFLHSDYKEKITTERRVIGSDINEEHPRLDLMEAKEDAQVILVNNSSAQQVENDLLQQMIAKKHLEIKTKPDMSYNVHTFYYSWYGNPQFDGRYLHWNHRFLPHWESRISKLFATGERHEPPNDIGANYYPLLGPYSSVDPNILQKHMEQLTKAGIGVISLSWYPPGKSDDEGKPSDYFVPTILDVASANGIKVCFHIEPYSGRNASSVADDIKYIKNVYGSHPAFYLTNDPRSQSSVNHELPLVYVYDSYLISVEEWKKVLTNMRSSTSIRGTPNDAIVIGLLVEQKHKKNILEGGFDGFYTYFASSGFSYGSDFAHWNELSGFARTNNLIFIPSVGPGYIDTNVRPWNGANTKERNGGAYYETSWQRALGCHPDIISITSFNEWHEGTQIEAALSHKSTYVKYVLGKPVAGMFEYESYKNNPDFYLDLTRKWVTQFKNDVN